MANNDIDYTPIKNPTFFEKIIIAATVLISWLFFQRKGKQK